MVGSGSGTVTSNPAPAICPVDRASYRSSWFTTPPLIRQKQSSRANVKSVFSPFHNRSVDTCLTVPAGIDKNGSIFHFGEQVLVADLFCFWCESAAHRQEI